MSRLKRPLFFILVPAVLVAGALGAFLQVSTTRALEHAEAFQFRRMLVTQRGDGGEYRFFFATNRVLSGAEGALEKRFGSQRGETLSLGLFDTAIEASLGVGMLINPTDWFRDEEIQLQRVRTLERAEWVRELRAQVEASPHRSLLVAVHGFRERFPSALRKTAFLAHVLDVDSPILVFDWPGDQGSSPRGYHRAQAVAGASGAELAKALRVLVEEVQPERLWLLANSMGGEVVVHAFSELYLDPDFADAAVEVDEVVLTAPDVSHADFGEQFKDEIRALSGNLTVYVSSNDQALLMSRILNRARRLGEYPVDPTNPDQSWEASRALELLEPGDDRVVIVDVTPINRTRNFHAFSLETPEFFDDLFLRLTNDETPDHRLRYRVRTSSGTEYWVLTRGR